MDEPRDPDTEELLDRARRGSESAVELLLGRHGDRLHRMVGARTDRIGRLGRTFLHVYCGITGTRFLDSPCGGLP